MNETRIDGLASLADHVDAVVGPLVRSVADTASDAQLVDALASAGRVLRMIEALIVEVTDEVARRSETAEREARLTTRFGCHDVSELVQRATRVGAPTASRFQRAGRAVRRETSIVTGERMPARLPAMRAALLDGEVGVDGLLAVSGVLAGVERRVAPEAVLAADSALAATARGEGADAAPPASADTLRLHASAWATVLDPDGSEPREHEAIRNRGITLGRMRNGVIPIGGGLLPEVAAQLEQIINALSAPRGAGDTGGVRFWPEADAAAADGGEWVPIDERRPAQLRHDALATALFAAAASGSLPTIGGSAPVLVVSVRESDLVSRSGYAHAEGCDEPLPIAAAHRVACAGIIQRITVGAEGRILRIGTEERGFNRHQRRAIALRDGGCIIPGCGVPAGWCEIHHVVEWAKGGPTHTDNGVLLCWFHHRFLEWHRWEIRMNRGVPEVKAPPWNDASGRWRPVTKSPTRLADILVRRIR